MNQTLDRTFIIKNGILNNCPNYDFIANFDVPKKDLISGDIKNNYADFITENIFRNTEINKVKRIDEILGEYVKKGKFYKLVQKTYNNSIKDNEGNEYIFDFFEFMDFLYSSYTEKTVVEPRKGTRWL